MSNATDTDDNANSAEATLAEQYEPYRRGNDLKQAFIAAATVAVSTAAGVVFYRAGFEMVVGMTSLVTLFSIYSVSKSHLSDIANSQNGEVFASAKISPTNKDSVTTMYKQLNLQKSLYVQERSVPIAAMSGDKLLLNQERFDLLPEKSKLYVIGHEFSHFINEDSEKGAILLLSLSIPNMAMIGASLLENNAALVSLSLGVTGVQALLYKFFSRTVEERADVHGVLLSGNAQNAEKCFNAGLPPRQKTLLSGFSDTFFGRQQNVSYLYDPSQLLKTHPSGAASKKAITKVYGYEFSTKINSPSHDNV